MKFSFSNFMGACLIAAPLIAGCQNDTESHEQELKRKPSDKAASPVVHLDGFIPKLAPFHTIPDQLRIGTTLDEAERSLGSPLMAKIHNYFYVGNRDGLDYQIIDKHGVVGGFNITSNTKIPPEEAAELFKGFFEEFRKLNRMAVSRFSREQEAEISDLDKYVGMMYFDSEYAYGFNYNFDGNHRPMILVRRIGDTFFSVESMLARGGHVVPLTEL